MRYFKFSAFLALCVFFLVGCGNSESSGGPVPSPSPPAVNQFAGLYKGSTSYQDAQRGTVHIPIQIRVADDGTVQFTVMSFGGTSTVTGSVDRNGILTASYPNSTARIIGRFYKEGTDLVIMGRITSEANGSIPASNNPFGAKRE